MRFSFLTAAVLGAATFCGGLSQAEAGGFGIGIGYGGFGYGPGLGGFYGSMVPGYPYYGNGVNLSLSRNNNYVRRSSNYATVQKTGDNKPILIVCPADAGAALNFRLNNTDYVLKPGETRLLTNDRKYVVTFDRGGEHGTARYSMSAGTYTFGLTADHGWELYHDADLSKFSATNDGVMKNALPTK